MANNAESTEKVIFEKDDDLIIEKDSKINDSYGDYHSGVADIKINYAYVQALIKLCNDLIDFLFELNYQLAQIIEAKNKSCTKANTDMDFIKLSEISKSKENLEKIMATLPSGISDANQLAQQIPKLTQNNSIEN